MLLRIVMVGTVNTVLVGGLLLSCSCAATWVEDDAQPMRPQVVRLEPNRPRFVYTPPTYPQRVLAISDIRVEVRDPRPLREGQRDSRPAMARAPKRGIANLPLPDDFQQMLMRRVDDLGSGEGATVRMVVTVARATVTRKQNWRRVDVSLNVVFLSEAGDTLTSGTGTGSRTLHGPPYDDKELHAIYRAVYGDAADTFLLSDDGIPALINVLGKPALST